MILVMSDANHQYTSKTTTKEDQAKMVSIHILHAQCPVDAKILRSTFPLLASMSLGLYNFREPNFLLIFKNNLKIRTGHYRV